MMKHNKELLVGLGMAVWLVLDFGEGVPGLIVYLAVALPLSIGGSYIQAKGMSWRLDSGPIQFTLDGDWILPLALIWPLVIGAAMLWMPFHLAWRLGRWLASL